jgi:hypothetical protein
VPGSISGVDRTDPAKTDAETPINSKPTDERRNMLFKFIPPGPTRVFGAGTRLPQNAKTLSAGLGRFEHVTVPWRRSFRIKRSAEIAGKGLSLNPNSWPTYLIFQFPAHSFALVVRQDWLFTVVKISG